MNSARHCVLLVEDEPALAGVLEMGLRQEPWHLEVVHEGRRALTAVRESRFDLIILDLGLPDIEGFEILKLLKKDPQTEAIPVIVFTGWQGTGEKLRAFELGAVDYVTKPFELAELRARVRSVLRQKSLQDALRLANQELEAARAQAQEIARVKTEFLAKMSHEIRSPMNGVVAMTGLLAQTALSPEQREYVETIRTSGETVLAIINDILNFSKLERGMMELEVQPFDLRLCLEEALDLVAHKAAEKGLDLVCDLEREPPSPLMGDATRLRQVLINLLSNAVKFTAAGEVVVRATGRLLRPDATPPPSATGAAEAPLWELSLSVRDTGIGIPASQLHRLFQTFVQADRSVARRFGGTGLGLAISKGLVELMGGRLWAESVEGKGSTFHLRIHFPLSARPEPNPLNAPQPHLAGRRVLVVDDNETSRATLVRQLQRWGLKADAVPGAEALLTRLADGHAYDLAFIDLRLGGTDGTTLPAQLRSRFASPPRCVLLTPFGAAQTVKKESNGFVGYLNKPVKRDSLYELLLRVLPEQAAVPAPASAASDASQPEHRSPLAERFPLRILLADDNTINQRVGVRLLQQLGYTPEVVANGLEALAAYQRHPHDLILMDVSMPQMDGLEAARHIREFEKKSALPPCVILALTAHAMPGDRETTLAAGMDEHLTKPVPPALLEATIHRFADRLKSARTAAVPPPALDPAPTVPAPTSSAPGALGPPPASPDAKPVPAPASVGEPVVDWERLRESAGGSPEQVRELVTMYLSQTEEQVAEMQKALEGAAAPVLKRVAHNCAGASALCGAVTLVPLLRRIELAAKEGRLAEAQENLDRAVREFGRVRDALLEQGEREAEPVAA